MGYSAKAIANYFLSKYGKHGISPLKMQKLVYLAHGWYMAFHDDPLVDDEYAEAWEYGPVFASLYHEFKHRGRLPIIDHATEVSFDHPGSTTPKIKKSDKETPKLLDRIWEVYGNRTGMQLSRITHAPNSPWEKTRKDANGRRNANISDTDIREFYKAELARSRNRNRG